MQLDFQYRLFNLFTLGCPEGMKGFMFSQRMRIVRAMIAAMEAEVAIIQAEQQAHLGPPKRRPAMRDRV